MSLSEKLAEIQKEALAAEAQEETALVELEAKQRKEADDFIKASGGRKAAAQEKAAKAEVDALAEYDAEQAEAEKPKKDKKEKKIAPAKGLFSRSKKAAKK